MELTEKQIQTKKLLTSALSEAWENDSFKKDFINNPDEAIKNLTGKKLELKEGTKMVVVDQSDKDTFYFNIPAKPNMEDFELTEAQLEAVSGGGWGGAMAGAIVGFYLGGPLGAVAGGVAGYALL